MEADSVTVDGVTYKIADLCYSDLAVRYHTGRSTVITGSGRNRVTGYRTGVMTELGDLELSVWQKLMMQLISRTGEDALFKSLVEWVSALPWLHSEKETELYALELHAGRIFDDPTWKNFLTFNMKYRPEMLAEGGNNVCK